VACNLVVIFGPPAVGKMSVGHALAERTGYKLFHNHMSIELALQFFDYGTPAFRRLVEHFRQEIFAEAIAAPLPGLIFTWVWAFDQPQDREYLFQLTSAFAQAGGQRYLVELEADPKLLFERNRGEFRLQHKPSKRNLDHSEAHLKEVLAQHRLNSGPEEADLFSDPYLRINNSALSPDQVAEKIQAHFQLR